MVAQFVVVIFTLSLVVLTSSYLNGSYVDEYTGFEFRDFRLLAPFENVHRSNVWLPKDGTIVSSNSIVLTPADKSRRGSIWSQPVGLRDWEIQTSLLISQPEGRFGDGIAIWYTKSAESGALWGAAEQFTGIGVVLDTYRNSQNHLGSFRNKGPRLFVLYNEGNIKADFDEDGYNVRLDGVDGGCQLPESILLSSSRRAGESGGGKDAIRIVIRYENNTLEVHYALADDQTWQYCAVYKNLFLPKDYMFGLSANTGDLNSNQEIISLRVSSFFFDIPHKDPAPAPSAVRYLGNPDSTLQEEIVNTETRLSDNNGSSAKYSVLSLILYILLIGGLAAGLYFLYDRYFPDEYRLNMENVRRSQQKRFY